MNSFKDLAEISSFPNDEFLFGVSDIEELLWANPHGLQSIIEISEDRSDRLWCNENEGSAPENQLFEGENIDLFCLVNPCPIESDQSLFEAIDREDKPDLIHGQDESLLILYTTNREEILSKINSEKAGESEDIEVNTQEVGSKHDSTSADSDNEVDKKRLAKSTPKKWKLSTPSIDSDEDSMSTASECNYDLAGQILRGLNGDFSLTEDKTEVDPKKKRGRPEVTKDVSPEALNSAFAKFAKSFWVKASSRQRIDAKTATLARHLKKITDVFLKYIGSKCQYKSKELNVVLRAYLKSFVLGFCKFFHLEDAPNKDELFLHYIVLCFPEKKVLRILGRLQKQGFKPCGYFKSLKDSLKLRKLAAKWSFQDLFKTNFCFKIIFPKIIETIPDLNISDPSRISEILGDLMQ